MGEPVKKLILYGGRFAGVKPGIFGRLGCGWKNSAVRLLARWGWMAAQLTARLRRLNDLNMACVDGMRLQPLARVAARGRQSPDLQAACMAHRGLRWGWFLHQWVRMDELYIVEWSKLVFDNFENSGIILFCFLTNGVLIPIVGGRNHWWWLWNTQRG